MKARSVNLSLPNLALHTLFFKVLAADQRDARYGFAQRVIASSLLTPCARWRVDILGGAFSKREVRAPATRIWH